MASSNELPAPVFLKWFSPDAKDAHVFVRSDWLMEFVFDHLPHEDAMRLWGKMCAERIRGEEGDDAAQDFLDAFGITDN